MEAIIRKQGRPIQRNGVPYVVLRRILGTGIPFQKSTVFVLVIEAGIGKQIVAIGHGALFQLGSIQIDFPRPFTAIMRRPTYLGDE